jgi:spore germination cell wall hydrolase CwlJ-like protein
MLENGKVKFIAILAFMISIFGGLQYSIEQQRLSYYNELAAREMALLVKKSVKPINTEQLRCMANNIYHEAGSEPYMGQVAVARVVMNRIKHGFASNPCKVIHQSTTLTQEDETRKICQFSWVCEGKTTPARNAAYLQAEEIARKVLTENKWADVIPGNVLFFHQAAVNPAWTYKKVMTIGNHIFYSKGKETPRSNLSESSSTTVIK